MISKGGTVRKHPDANIDIEALHAKAGMNSDKKELYNKKEVVDLKISDYEK